MSTLFRAVRCCLPFESLHIGGDTIFIDFGKQMPSLHIEHRVNFVAEVVAHFDGDFACWGSCERLAGGSVEGRPGRLKNFGPQCPLEFILYRDRSAS